ncbi:MAG: hypothetical protein KGN34_10920 [Sphingomonadales bacterium]|nr:hypothetical protein [Sphingomonadales bacterium]
MKPSRILALAALSTLALAACHKGAKSNDQRTASGQVLEGSISDAMIPYESLKSKPPLAPRAATRGAVTAAAGDAAAPDAATGGDAPADPAPAASPSAAIRF